MAVTTDVNQHTKRGISKKKFNTILILIALIIIGIFIASYFLGKFWKPYTQALSFSPGPPTYLYSITGEGKDGMFSKPMAVAVINKNIYIVDNKNYRVQVFDYNGKYLSRWGKKGNGQGQFEFPYGIAGDAQNNVYVADLRNGNIQVFTPEGKFIKYFAQKEVGSPTALFIRDGKLFVSDIKTDSIKVFDVASGKKLLEFGKHGKGNGQLDSANGVTVTADRVYVSDTGNDRIQVFSLDGKFLSKMDGSKNGRNPKAVTTRGIGVDGRGVIYSASLIGNYVNGFSTKGDFLWTFGTMGGDEGQFYLPNGLFVDEQGRIYVTDQGNDRVSVWEN